MHKVDWNNADDLQDLPIYNLVIAADVVSDKIRNKRCHVLQSLTSLRH